MLKYGSNQSQAGHTLFVKHSSHGKTTTLIVYVDDIVLTRDDVEEIPQTGMLGGRPCETPLESSQKLSGDQEGDPADRGRYQRLVEKLIYLSHSRSDIVIAVSMVNQFMHASRTSHLEAVMRILRYLKSSLGNGLYFSKHGHLSVEAFIDADWAGSVTDRRSTSGYCTFVGGNLVT
ncbi:uncharacterized protein LOC114290875 [Camellia sinensis]|uniref:uncharacterized protein LOC114290875 n=1 Tax=Camellia sinensis TaxID=4442 RepID=UPI0010364335|nr:uncharacterized protein LOC114290875 [Camellia sinensis]